MALCPANSSDSGRACSTARDPIIEKAHTNSFRDSSGPIIFLEESMAALIEAITVKRKMYFEFENTPYYCMDAEVSTPTARGGQTLVRLKMRNLLTRAVFDKTFKAQDKF